MNHSNLWRRIVSGMVVVAAVATLTFSGCTQVDNTLGSDLTLSDQSLKIGQMNIGGFTENGTGYFEARLFKSDSINSGGLSSTLLGANRNDTFGMRTAGLFTQYISANTLDEDELFGYMPIFDSAVLYLSIDAYGGDTNYVQQYEVYEVIDNSFITESADSIFFTTFNMEPYLASGPLFTFNFPDQANGVYTDASYIKLNETDLSKAFIDRLMLKTITGDYDESIYTEDEEWVEEFKGIYIRPVLDKFPSSGTNGAIYSTTMSSSGFGFYGRSREESDPTLIKDTVGMTYVFYSDYAEAGNISINTISNDYTNSLIEESQIKTDNNPNVETTSTMRVEGMAGVVTEITLAKELFAQLDTILEAEEAETGEVYTSLFFNQAKLKIYMADVTSYDIDLLDPWVLTPWMDYMPSGLGLYADYTNYAQFDDADDYSTLYYTLTGIPDYLYAYESSYTLDYSGALNRSWGCYVMNIPSYLQAVWNYYLEAKEEADRVVENINWDDVEYRSIYLAPYAMNLFGTQYATLQAGNPSENLAPMTLEVTYTMIR
ncbi:MAG: DUF4270 family protein [Rikenellaceae bacterium]